LSGAVFTRENVKEIQKRSFEKFIEVEQRKLINEEANLEGLSLSESEKKERIVSLEYRKKLLESLAKVEIPGRIIINLAKVLDKVEGKKYDVLIEDGDSLYIPQIPSSVQILGAVHNPGAVFYESGKNADYYLSRVGSFTKYADKKGVYLIRASGATISDFKQFKERIKRGDTIIVPEEFKYRTPIGLLVKDISRILYHLGIAVAAVGVL